MEALTSRSNWNIEVVVFVEGRKPENPEKNLREQGENQQQTHMRRRVRESSPGIEPGSQRWEASALIQFVLGRAQGDFML